MWLTVLVAVLDGAIVSSETVIQDLGLSHRLTIWNCHSWFHIVQSNLKYENKGFLSNVVGDFKKQKYLFFCVLSVSFIFSTSLFLFFAQKQQKGAVASQQAPTPPHPCLSLWVCYSTRVNQYVSGHCLTWHWYCWSPYLKTLYTEWDEIFMCGRTWRFLQKCSFSASSLKWSVSQSVQVFCQINVFCQMLCFNCRCLIVS